MLANQYKPPKTVSREEKEKKKEHSMKHKYRTEGKTDWEVNAKTEN